MPFCVRTVWMSRYLFTGKLWLVKALGQIVKIKTPVRLHNGKNKHEFSYVRTKSQHIDRTFHMQIKQCAGEQRSTGSQKNPPISGPKTKVILHAITCSSSNDAHIYKPDNLHWLRIPLLVKLLRDSFFPVHRMHRHHFIYPVAYNGNMYESKWQIARAPWLPAKVPSIAWCRFTLLWGRSESSIHRRIYLRLGQRLTGDVSYDASDKIIYHVGWRPV